MVPEIQTGKRSPSSIEDFLDGVDRGLRVQRVEDGLDHDEIGAALR